MSPLRLAVLTLGPALIVAGSYALSRPTVDPERAAFLARVQAAEVRSAEQRQRGRHELETACRKTEQSLRSQLPKDFLTLVRPPFVLAGDIEADRLESFHQHGVQPISEAIWRAYCDHRPDGPVTVVMVESDATYKKIARDLDGYDVTAYAAYYNRETRRIVMTVGSGSGTLAHELTHALVQFDFVDLPEWLDEGLASLHEETEFSADGLMLVPQPNWRCRLLAEAVRRDCLPTLEDLVKSHSFRGEGEGLNYAFVRGLCLYLHERGLLSHFYRKFRAQAPSDPSGLETLCEVLAVKQPSDLDHDFSRWIVRRFEKPAPDAAATSAR